MLTSNKKLPPSPLTSKKKLSANEQQKAEFKKEPLNKFSTQAERPVTAFELIVRNEAPQARTLAITPQIEAFSDKVNTDSQAASPEPKFEPAFQAPPTPYEPLHGHG